MKSDEETVLSRHSRAAAHKNCSVLRTTSAQVWQNSAIHIEVRMKPALAEELWTIEAAPS